MTPLRTISFFLFLFLFLDKEGSAQSVTDNTTKDSFRLVRSYEGDIANVALDNLDNLYIVNSKGAIRKFNAAGDSLGVYNQVRNYGNLFSLDVSNPLKLLLFYKDFSTIVVLDRFLSTVTTLDLRRINIIQPVAIGMSYDNNIWVFDEYDNRLKKIDEQGNLLLETADLRTAFNVAVTPQQIINDNRLVYLADSANGLFVFDNYGSFQKKIVLKNWQSISVSRDHVISSGNGLITYFNTRTQLQTERRAPRFQPYFHSFTSATKFVSFSNSRVEVYELNH